MRTSARWLLAVSVLVAGLLSIEVALRVIAWSRPATRPGRVQGWDTIWAYSRELHHRLLPHGVVRHRTFEYDYVWTNNALGMRDRERSLTRGPGTLRILVLGDSFVEGQSVPLEDAMTARLESILNRSRSERAVEVWNAGVFGYSPMLESLYLRQLMDTVAPDLVIVGLALVNDVGDDYYYARAARYTPGGAFSHFDDRRWPWSKYVQAVDAQEPVAPGARPSGPWDRAASSALSSSRIYETISTWTARQREERRAIARRQRELALIRNRAAEIDVSLGLINRPVLTREQRLDYWTTSLRYLADMSKRCRARGIPFVAVVIPPYQRLSGELTFDEPYEILEEFGRKAGVPIVQLLPDFERLPVDDTYFRHDRHWTANGNALAAAVVARELRRLELLPAAAGGWPAAADDPPRLWDWKNPRSQSALAHR